MKGTEPGKALPWSSLCCAFLYECTGLWSVSLQDSVGETSATNLNRSRLNEHY